MNRDRQFARGDRSSAVCPRRFELIKAAIPEEENLGDNSVLAHAASCARCGAIVAGLRLRREEFLKEHPFGSMRERIFSCASHRIRRRTILFRLVPAAAAFLAGVVALSFLLPGKEGGGSIRTKGDLSLSFFVQKGDQAVAGVSGGKYHANDRIQFTYSTGSGRYLFLVSLDERGNVTNFNHDGRNLSVPIVPGMNRILEGSIILDDSVGPERIYAVFSDRPIEFAEIEKAARQAFSRAAASGGVRTAVRLPLPWPQASILLEKE